MAAINRAIKNRLLSAVSQADLETYFSELQPVLLKQRQVLYAVGDAFDSVYFVEEGIASVITTMSTGASVEVGMVGIEGMVGASAMLGAAVSVQHVIVQVPGSALRLNATQCKKAFEESPAIRRVVLRFIDSLLAISAQTAACNRLHPIEQRCARWLLMASDRLQSDVMPMTHEFLATMLGARRAGVSEAAAELQRSGLIRYHHGQITIIDHDNLIESACECYRLDHDRLHRLM